ncbi:MAG: cell division protein FtsZ [Candidatus Eisenbacteria bacterium]
MLIEVSEEKRSPAVLKVLGIGGAGSNAVNRMIASEIRGVEFLVANTDVQALSASVCQNRIQIGNRVTGGLGSGGKPELGRKSAEEDAELIRGYLQGADMVFLAAGMGGGTGTGASAVIARIAREMGALTVAIVTKPFSFEGRRRMTQAEDGLEDLRDAVDTLIVIPNQRLLHVVDRATPFTEALRIADDVLTHATKGISEIITVPGLINVDFADVSSVMTGMGNALMGMGFGQGPDRARLAADMAISSPLLEDISIAGAQALLVNFMGGEDMTLTEVDEASNLILEAAGAEANVIFGAVIVPSMKEEIRVTLIATGFGNGARSARTREAQREAERELACEAATHQAEAEAQPESVEQPEEAAPVYAQAEEERMVSVAGAGRGGVIHGRAWGTQPANRAVDLADGVVGPARPIRGRPGARPAAAFEGAVSRASVGVEQEDPPSVSAAQECEPALPGRGAANVVPLVWKKNLQGARWAPQMSSRWQRVLRRDQSDVPSFMRRRQMD